MKEEKRIKKENGFIIFCKNVVTRTRLTSFATQKQKLKQSKYSMVFTNIMAETSDFAWCQAAKATRRLVAVLKTELFMTFDIKLRLTNNTTHNL